jgi:hypothetical protein
MDIEDDLIEILQGLTQLVGRLLAMVNSDRDTIGEMAARVNTLDERLAQHLQAEYFRNTQAS